MSSIKVSTRAYEGWLKAQLGRDLVAADLREKHAKMRSGAFAFLRATYWRWAEIILEVCPNLTDAPPVLAIGDTHLENFGTWRDAEGRLVWGANDFDDCAVMPWPLDLVRLATSALLARDESDPDGPTARAICKPILDGYTAGLADPAPFVLERDHAWLRQLVMLPEASRAAFWTKFFALPAVKKPPARYAAALLAAMPDPEIAIAIAPRTAGTGSLGRPRFLARGEWRGGPVLREAKLLAQSAWALHHAPRSTAIRVAEIAGGRFRAPDPRYRVKDDILVRRLSPNSRKIEVKQSAIELLSPRMLAAMGREIANCHANDPDRLPALREDLARRGKAWLREAAKVAAASVAREQQSFAG
ncbi:MAG TPA: DUF2252 family protein [Roseomonas sp.]